MIEINPENYYIGMWFFELPKHFSRFGNGGDFMMCVSRKKTEPTTWKIVFRFRHKKDDRIWDSDDEKSWYSATATNKTEAQIEQDMHDYIKTIGVVAHEIGDFFPIHGDGDEFARKITESPPKWMHAKHLTKEEAKKECLQSDSSTTSS